jgi:hypothetical protein
MCQIFVCCGFCVCCSAARVKRTTPGVRGARERERVSERGCRGVYILCSVAPRVSMMQTQKKVSKAAATGPRGEINLSSPRVNSFLLATDEACKFLISNLKASNRARPTSRAALQWPHNFVTLFLQQSPQFGEQ